MTQTQLIELIQQHHPNMGQTEARIHLNEASKIFCSKSRIIKRVLSDTGEANKRYYRLNGFEDLNDAQTGKRPIFEVYRANYDGYAIPRLSGRPEKLDTSETAADW